MPPALSKLTAAALAALLAIWAPSARAGDWRDMPYADIAKMPLVLAKVDPQHVFTVVLRALPGEGKTALPADFRLQLKVNGQLIPVPVAADGKLSLPFRQDWVDAGAVLQNNQPKGLVAISMNFDARVPPGTRMSYAQLTESAPVLEKGISKMAGVMSFMAPDVKSFNLRFDKPPQTLTLTLSDGKKRSYKTDAKGVIVLPWEAKWAAGTVELSAPLKGIDQTLK